MMKTRNGSIKNLTYLCLLGVIVLGLMTIVGSNGGGGGGGSVTPTDGGGDGDTVTVSTITVTPSLATVNVNQTQQFAATAKDADGNTIVGVSFTWASSNPSVATIDSNGLAVAVAAGTTTITASSSGVTSSGVTLTVTELGTIPADFSDLVNAGGGVEGGSIADTMSVVVFDARTWTPISGATVSVGTDGTNSTTTDNDGLAIFSGLSGAQTITVLADGFETIITLGGVDAIRIAIPLHKTPESATVTKLTGQTDASTMMVKTNFGANGSTLFSNPFSGDLTGTYTTSSGAGIIPGFAFAISAFSPVTLRPLNGVSTPSTYSPPDILVFTDQTAMSSGETRTLDLDFSSTSEADLTRFTIDNNPVRLGPTIGPLVMEGSALAIYAKLPNDITSFTPRTVFQNDWPYNASPEPLLVGESEWLEGADDAQGAFREIEGVDGYEIATIGLDLGGHVWYSSLHFTSAPVSPVGPFTTISPADADDFDFGLPEYNATGVGTTPTLGWEQVDPANFYKVTLWWTSSASMGGHWTIYLPAGSNSFTIPTLPTSVASAGLQIDERVNWDVQPMIITDLDFNNMTGTSIRNNIQSLCVGGDSYFTP